MISWIALTLLVGAALGMLVLFFQALSVRRHLRERPRRPRGTLPGISILKPLCGIDDDLEANIESFAALEYPHFELLLGVREDSDPAYPLARRAAQRWPGRVRVVIQEGLAGFNPKVNQLICLARAARHDLLVVSDANVRVGPPYLHEIAACFEDPQVACVTHPVVGWGELALGALLDNLHLSSSIGPGQIAAKRVTDRDLVVGKSMALRRSDLDALGGFEAYKDVLAEDYVFGRAVTEVLGKRVVLAHSPVFNVSRRRATADFIRRYARWSVIHRTAVEPLTYFAQALLNPAPLAVIAAMLARDATVARAAAAVLLGKVFIDVWVGSMLRGSWFGASATFAVPIKDALLFAAWVNGLWSRTVVWRGQRLRVESGSRLVPLHEAPEVELDPL